MGCGSSLLAAATTQAQQPNTLVYSAEIGLVEPEQANAVGRETSYLSLQLDRLPSYRIQFTAASKLASIQHQRIMQGQDDREVHEPRRPEPEENVAKSFAEASKAHSPACLSDNLMDDGCSP